ncbi:ABC transporter permease [Aureimonas fodinaquatilis]|uniref:ABC transporter permease n=1 Tax=Aureimonas fodinaquatilis TaxID=2565783 RepID=A0A5B0DQ46_9HYPH|nr:ABC transporter permease [Aureimonas fodinaquatilis]KAA0968894.1 ABC transporter permease [Aureimonas fodinaquatilis]
MTLWTTMILGRLAQTTLVALTLVTVCFVFVHALPGDTALRIAEARGGAEFLNLGKAQQIAEEEGLNRPILVQYGEWVGRIATGDLGVSLVTGQSVASELWQRGKNTLILGIAGWLASYLVALPIGIYAALRPHGWVDRASSFYCVTMASLPSFLMGIGLISIFALSLRWLPPAGFRSWSHLILPAATLALGLSAFSIRLIRDTVREVNGNFFITFARTKGLTATAALRQNGSRNAAIPIVAFAALQFAAVVDGFIMIETLFNYPGLGELLVSSMLARDVPMVMGAGLVAAIGYGLVNLAADLVSILLDPRLSHRDQTRAALR